MDLQLHSAHLNELARVLQHSRTWRDRNVQDVARQMEDFEFDRFTDDIMSKQDIASAMFDMRQQVTDYVRAQMTADGNRSVAHMAQLLQLAQASGLSLEADVMHAEDTGRTESIVSSLEGINPPPARRLQSLPTLGGGADPGEIADLKEENRKMLDRYQQMQAQVTELLQERSLLAEELETVKTAFKDLKASLGGQGAGATAAMEQALEQAKAETERKQYELEALRQESQRTINESSQFREMRQIIAKKNQQVKEMRRRLQQYEPCDDVPLED